MYRFPSKQYLTADLESKYLTTADLESKYLKTAVLESKLTLNKLGEATWCSTEAPWPRLRSPSHPAWSLWAPPQPHRLMWKSLQFGQIQVFWSPLSVFVLFVVVGWRGGCSDRRHFTNWIGLDINKLNLSLQQGSLGKICFQHREVRCRQRLRKIRLQPKNKT